LSVEWIVMNVGRIRRCKGRPQFPGGMMSCVMLISAAPARAEPLMAEGRAGAAHEDEKSPITETTRTLNAGSFIIEG